jgi:hypothetical protein
MNGDSKSTAHQDDGRPLSLDFRVGRHVIATAEYGARGQVPGAGGHAAGPGTNTGGNLPGHWCL